MSDLKKLAKEAIAFRDARDWKQFHNPKDLALSLMLEAAELAEHFQWKSADEMAVHLVKHQEDVADEMADVLVYLLFMSHDFGIDLAEATRKKLKKNAEKYPVAKARGKHTKYTQLT